MFKQLSDLTKAFVFYGIALALATGLVMLPGASGDGVQLLTMCTPLVALLLLLLVITPDGHRWAGWRGLGLGRAGWRTWGAALLMPVSIQAGAYAILWRTTYADPARPAATGWAAMLFHVLANFAILLLFALAEEVGWRGYLLPRLLSLGARRATLLTGFLHGLWHLPLLLLTPFYHTDGRRLIVVPLFLLSLTLAGPIYGYWRLTSGSVWPAAIAHAALNASWGFFSGITVASAPVAAEYLAGESGVLALLGYAVVAAWCLARLRPNKLVSATLSLRPPARPAVLYGVVRPADVPEGTAKS